MRERLEDSQGGTGHKPPIGCVEIAVLNGLGLIAGMASYTRTPGYEWRPAWPVLAVSILAVIAGTAHQMLSSGRQTLVAKIVAFKAGVLVRLLFLALAFAIGMVPYLLETAQPRARRDVCLYNMKRLAEAALMYASDHDHVLPPAQHWSDAIAHYSPIRDEGTFWCPSSLGERPRDQRWSDYAINEPMGGANVSRLTHSDRAVLLFESELGWDAAGGRPDLPSTPRHFDGDSYAFADAHAKWYPRRQAGQLGWSARD